MMISFFKISAICWIIILLGYFTLFTFVEDAPHSFLLWQQPAVETRYLFEVRTSADEQQPKYKDAV